MHEEADEPLEAVLGLIRGAVDGLQLLFRQNPFSSLPYCRSGDGLHRGAVDDVLSDAPAEERPADAVGVLLFGWFEGIEQPDDLAGLDIPHALSPEGEVDGEVTTVEPDADGP